MSMDKGLHIRLASLEDTAGVTAVHCSHVGRWTRTIGAEADVVPYESLSIDEHWGFGGPWMSVETCAIHLNNLLLRRQYPIVALIDDHVVGEMELFIGREGEPFGKNAHIGLLYVHKNHTRKGIGKALIDKAAAIAADNACDTLTVVSAPSVLGFYKRCRFCRSGTMVELEARTKDYGAQMKAIPGQCSDVTYAWGMSMPVGRYQSSAFHLFELSDMYAIPGTLSAHREILHVEVAGARSLIYYVTDESQERATVLGWTQGAGAEAMTMAALSALHAKGVKYANILLSFKDYQQIEGRLEAAVKGSRDVLVRKP